MISTLKQAKKIFDENFKCKKNEKALIVTDDSLFGIGKILYDAAIDYGLDAVIMSMKPRFESADEPPEVIYRAMQAANVIIIPTLKSLTHTKARRDACSNGARVATMPGITMPVFNRILACDYVLLRKLSAKLEKKLVGVEKIRVMTKLGTDITFYIKGRIVESDVGVFYNKGDYGNLPAGEVSLSPIENSTEGVYYIDGSVFEKKVKKPIKVTVKRGYATAIEGDNFAKEIFSRLKSVGKNAFNIAELGIGTNPCAILTGNILEDEKIYGTCHIAFGNNKSYGGNVDVAMHQDAIIKSPTIYFDGKKIMLNGELL
ncbi:MAG: aminopeptidase [archaeon]